jgi:primosomal protein N' (replication factor Y)
MCRNCDVALTYHKAQNVLRCHYCGFTEVAHAACTVCGSLEVRESGTGTQRVEEDLRGALTERLTSVPRIERLDADTTARKGEHRSILRRFSRGEIDVLVGTQMIAKGLDIPRVTLVVVVNADMSLHQTDFRASERTVQLLTQVAGRAGRSGDRPGTMIVQTSSPDHPAIVASLRGERDPAALRAWEQEEMRLRAEVQYPPHSRFIVIEVRSLEEHLAENHIRILAALLPPRTDYMVRLEPVTPPIGRIRNQYRRLIVIKNIKSTDPSGGMCRSLLRNAFATYHAQYSSSGVHVTVDVDAYGTV